MQRLLLLLLLVILVVMVSGTVSANITSSGQQDFVQQGTALFPTNTPYGEPEITDTPLPSETPEPTATATLTHTPLPPTSTPTETATPVPTQNALATPTVLYPLNPEPGMISGGTAIPTRMPLLIARDREGTEYEVINFLMLGHDSASIDQADGVFRTDTMIIVSVNLTTNTVSMISLPRDLYVYIPDWGMQRLNLAYGRGESIGWTDGGFGLLRQTILYNFGIRIHYYAMVDFDGFKQIIDTLGGVTIPVDCPIQDWRFTGEYDEEEEPIFKFVTLPVGVHEMDSITALFYARSRKNSSDFDRGRRQQQIMRAIWYEAKQGDYLNNIPALYEDLTEIVDTNIPLDVMIQLAPLALTLDPNAIENHFFRLGYETQPFTSPDGSNVQLPTLAIINTIRNFLTPPTENNLFGENANIAIYDNSGTGNHLDIVAAERLVWEGLFPVARGEGAPPEEYSEMTGNILIDYGSSKGSSVKAIADTLQIPLANQFESLDANIEVEVAVYLDKSYSSCFNRDVNAPIEITPTPES